MIDDYNEDFFEDMAKAYPELMEKAIINSFGVGKGWHKIIDILCGCIYSELHSTKSMLRAATEYPRNDNNKFLTESTIAYEKALAALPVIRDVKEKYGTMRFYVRHSDARVDSLIDFAEAMSAITCEKCGNPGTIDDSAGWIKTHCKTHQGIPVSTVDEFSCGSVSPNLFND